MIDAMRAVTVIANLATLAAGVVCAACGAVDPGGSKGPIQLQQATTWNATGGRACVNADKFIGETSFYRAFKLADHDVHGPFAVTSVAFTVNERVIGTGFTRFPIDINIYDYTGEIGDTLDTTKFTLLKTSSVDILATTPIVMPVKYELPLPAEVTAPAFVFKIHVQNYEAQMHKFFLAVNKEGETAPGFVACGANAPKTPTALGFPGDVLLMSVTGEAR